MAKKINLINTETRKTFIFLRLKRQLRYLLTIFTAVFILVTVVIMSVFFLTQRTIKKNQEKIASLRQTIKNLDKNESYAITIANRINGLAAVFKDRVSFAKTMMDIKLLLVPGFNTTSLDVGRDGSLKIAGVCENIQSLTNFNERIEQLNRQGTYKKTIYPSVNRTTEGRYSVLVELND